MLSGLNAAQIQAVTAPPGQLLVLAGAGSGKTRVLTHRIAWLVQQGAALSTVLAVTFTNKAATEIKNRLQTLLNQSVDRAWVGTFHGIAHRLLRSHGALVGLPTAFQIMDSDDQVRLLRHILADLQIDDKTCPVQRAQYFINACKDEGLRPEHIEPTYQNQLLLPVYRHYQAACQRAGLVDFAELLLAVHELWRAHPVVLQHYQQQFRHILVDEFQDTNVIQYAWIRLLAQAQQDVLVVGDDDQSIYRWRGAKVENLQDFGRDFAHARVVRLEQNYRSTATILAAANAVITHNQQRLGKQLWTEAEVGEKIQVYEAFNEQEEARFVINKIQSYLKQGYRGEQIAILYRTNALSRLFEEYLVAARLDYQIYGGLRFFERSEIKDVLAYLRLIQYPSDDAALLRVINVPVRGVGERSLDKIRQAAQQQVTSLWQAALHLADTQQLPTAACQGIRGMQQLLAGFAQQLPLLNGGQISLQSLLVAVIQQTQVMQFYQKEPKERQQARLENLQELGNAARQFEEQYADERPLLESWLAHIALDSTQPEANEKRDPVQLMTLHSAKGLEFPVVFMVGMEEDGFPHVRAKQDPAELEEERRLCYVGITRAEKHLLLTWAGKRYQFNKESLRRVSRFIAELPSTAVSEFYRQVPINRPRYAAPPENARGGLTVGQRVQHLRFGAGRIAAFEGEGDHARVQVVFEQSGRKWLVMAYANLQAI